MRISTARHARRRSRRARVVAVCALALVPIGIGGGAYAYWSATGAGVATASSTTAAPLSVQAAAAPFTGLFPGKTTDLALVLSNGNGYPVNLTELTGVSVTSSDETACPGGVYITLPAEVTTGLAAGGYLLPTPIPVPAGSTSTPATLAGLITMDISAPDGCQGRTFTVSLSFAGSQV